MPRHGLAPCAPAPRRPKAGRRASHSMPRRHAPAHPAPPDRRGSQAVEPGRQAPGSTPRRRAIAVRASQPPPLDHPGPRRPMVDRLPWPSAPRRHAPARPVFQSPDHRGSEAFGSRRGAPPSMRRRRELVPFAPQRPPIEHRGPRTAEAARPLPSRPTPRPSVPAGCGARASTPGHWGASSPAGRRRGLRRSRASGPAACRRAPSHSLPRLPRRPGAGARRVCGAGWRGWGRGGRGRTRSGPGRVPSSCAAPG